MLSHLWHRYCGRFRSRSCYSHRLRPVSYSPHWLIGWRKARKTPALVISPNEPLLCHRSVQTVSRESPHELLGQVRQSHEGHLASFLVRSDSHSRVTSRASWSGQTVTRGSPHELLGQVRQSLESHLTNFFVRSDSHSRVTSRASWSGQTVTRESPRELLGQVRQSLESHLASFLVRSHSHTRVPRELLGQVRQSWRLGSNIRESPHARTL